MPATPFLSVIVPVYEAEKYLPACIDSILNQTYRDLELILVDDGSLDGSGAMCDYYARKDYRILVHHKANGGASSARNAGLKLARGKFIGWVDSDDTIDPGMYQRLVSLANEYDADITECQFMMINNGKAERSGKDEGVLFGDNNFILHQFFASKMKPGLTTKIYKRELWKDINFPAGRIHQDCYVNMLFALQPLKYVRCSDPLYNYIVRSESITTTYSAKEIRQALYLYEYTKELATRFNSDNLRRQYLERDAVNRLLGRYFRVTVNSDIKTQTVYNRLIRKKLKGSLADYLIKSNLPLKTKVSLTLLIFNLKKIQVFIHDFIN